MSVSENFLQRPPDPQVVQVLVEPVPEEPSSYLSRWIYRQATPAVQWVWQVTVQTFKTEGVAITLLALSILGIFPVWMNLLLAIVGIVRLSWTQLQIRSDNQRYQESNRQLLQRIGVYEVSESERAFQVKRAEQARDEMIKQADAWRLQGEQQKDEVQFAQERESRANQEKEQVTAQLGALNGREDLLKQQNQLSKQQEEAIRSEVALLRAQTTDLQRQLDQERERCLRAIQEKESLEKEHISCASEKQTLRGELASLKEQTPSAFQESCARWAKEHAGFLQRIEQIALKMPSADVEGELEKEIEALCRWQREKPEVESTLQQALQGLSPDSVCRSHLEKLRLVWVSQNQSIESVIQTMRLQAALRAWLQSQS